MSFTVAIVGRAQEEIRAERDRVFQELRGQVGEIAVELAGRVVGHSLDKEIAWLVIHGTLQLLGYAHAAEDEAQHMEGLEQQALTALGLNEP